MPPDRSGSLPPLHRRRRAALRFAALCVVAAVAGVAAARFVQSPAQQAAAAAAPPPTQLTAPVRWGVLTATVITRGTVTAGGSVVVAPASALGAQRLVVSAVKVRAGALVRPGKVVGEVSGRPVLVLRGAVPAYRDLRSGDQGRDVTQLQRALAQAGFRVSGDPAGRFGAGTGQAIARLYKAAGYPPAGGPAHAYLPMSEIAYVPSFPARISQRAAGIGPLRGPLVTISYGRLRVAAQADPADGTLLRAGGAAQLTSNLTGAIAPAVIDSIGAPRSQPGSGNYLPVTIRPLRPLPASWLGQDVQVTISSARTKGKVLIVPVSAISTSADGQTSVLAERQSAGTVVPVSVGASADGFAAVRPDAGARLEPGEQVVVGQ